jgi:hypothetical protein
MAQMVRLVVLLTRAIFAVSPEGQRERLPDLAAELVRKGARTGDLPVERPMTFKLVVNLKAAKALGLTLSPTFLF